MIRASGTPGDTIATVNAALAVYHPALAVRHAVLDTQIGEGMLRERLMARLSAIFGAVALLLAVVGLYGVVSYTVASRRAEIGVRVALGATRSQILRMILGDVGRMIAIGIVVGSGLALLSARAVGSLLFGLGPHDPITLAIAAGALTVAGIGSALWPARRATGIDPISALRES